MIKQYKYICILFLFILTIKLAYKIVENNLKVHGITFSYVHKYFLSVNPKYSFKLTCLVTCLLLY